MQELIEEAIVRKARAVLRVQRIGAATQRKNAERYTKRTGLAAGAASQTSPTWWNFHPHFQPNYCIKHAKFLARMIWSRLQTGFYQPIPAIQFDIPKPDGSKRQIMAFSIPDSALANVIHRHLTARNLNLLSSHSYAYRDDKNIFDAILNLRRSLKGPKSYVVQYDFKRYFDSIDHDYLRKIIHDRDLFLITSAERVAIEAFLRHSYSNVLEYRNNIFDVREAGVPQGSSLSLFLSNAAAHALDLELESQNGSFVRFADDVVAITHSYSDALAVAARFRSHCVAAGLSINYEKSPGILLYGGAHGYEHRDFVMDSDDGADVRTIKYVDYLGHRVGIDGISLSDRTEKRVKRRISEIIYKHLFLHRRGAGAAFNPARVGAGFYDWDLVTCINEIRSYIYGGLREDQLIDFLERNKKLPFVRGLMGFFPLSTSVTQLARLDGWLLNVLRRAQRERIRILAGFGQVLIPLTGEQILTGSWYIYPDINNDARLPSFVRGWRASRKYYLRYGLSDISPPSYYSLMSY